MKEKASQSARLFSFQAALSRPSFKTFVQDLRSRPSFKAFVQGLRSSHPGPPQRMETTRPGNFRPTAPNIASAAAPLHDAVMGQVG
jgi:hypothetical protein